MSQSHNLTRATRTSGQLSWLLHLRAAAHAQGTMDFSGAQTLMGTFKTFRCLCGSCHLFWRTHLRRNSDDGSGRFQDAIPGLFGALFGAGVLGWGAGWIGSLTGQSMCEVAVHTTKRGELLPINQALNRPRVKLGLDLSAWMAIVFVNGNGFPRWVPIDRDDSASQ